MLTTTVRAVVLIGFLMMIAFLPLPPLVRVAGTPLIGVDTACAAVQECCDPALDGECVPDPECDDDGGDDNETETTCDKRWAYITCAICDSNLYGGPGSPIHFQFCQLCFEATEACRGA